MRETKVVILAKAGCHLCEAVEVEIRSTAAVIAGISVSVVDIDNEPALYDKYWMRVPVLTIGGEEVFEAKMMDPEGRWKTRLSRVLGISTET